jgi:integrase
VAFLSAAIDDRLHAAFVIAVVLGLRRGEIMGLRWTDVDFDAATLRVRQQIQRVRGELLVSEVKTERPRRVIPLPPIVLVALKARRLDQARDKLASHGA